jgi:hypothetical protein
MTGPDVSPGAPPIDPEDQAAEAFACAFDAEFGALFLRAFGEREADEHENAIIAWAWSIICDTYGEGYDRGRDDAESALEENIEMLKARVKALEAERQR